jgi:hypothetical protein
MTPNEIATFIVEMRPGELGLYSGSLYGYPVKNGTTPIDRLIGAVADAFIGWDMIHPRFTEACKQEFGKIPGIEEWSDLIADSDQMPQLKSKLLTIVGVPSDPAIKIPEGEGNFQVFFIRGTVVPVIHLEKSSTAPDVYYAALRPGSMTSVAKKAVKSGKSGRPSSFGKLVVDADHQKSYYEWCYGAIITFNPMNVWKVLSLDKTESRKTGLSDVQAFLRKREMVGRGQA